MPQGMFVVKIFCYENWIVSRISALREHELRFVRQLSRSLAAIMSILASATMVMTVSALSVYALMQPLTPEVVFASIYLFEILRYVEVCCLWSF